MISFKNRKSSNKNVCKYVKNQYVLNWTYGLFGQNYRVATLSTFYPTVSAIIIPSLKIIGQFNMPKFKN